ncbi:DEAD/DEAH box helicase [Citricoccus muralis]|uniref:Helicase-like protein n=1 Tax=Citricoccus muralis TaxID=169134 RepID=A0A3D9LEF8_9MICC|nr:DEAD/DEAH box helicase [Citricoccus muralis]REE04230.1 helicase-like protein [Citricoccus muralis]
MGTDRATLQRTISEVASWMQRAAALLGRRTQIMMDSTEANRRLSSAVLDLRPQDPQHQPTEYWRALPLGPDDGAHLAALARLRALPPIAAHEEEALASLAGGREQEIIQAQKLLGLRRLITFGQARHQAEQAARRLNDYRLWAHTQGLPQLLDRLEQLPTIAASMPSKDALHPGIGLLRHLPELGIAPELMPAEDIARLPRAIAALEEALRREAERRAAAHRAGVVVRDGEARALLDTMDVERLKDATADRLSTGPLLEAGITTVLQVWDRGAELEALDGVGKTTATRLRGAARTLWDLAVDGTGLRLDPAERTDATTELLRRTRAWEQLLPLRRATAGVALAEALAPLAHAQAPGHPVLLAPRARTAAQFREAVPAVLQLAGTVPTEPQTAPDAGSHPDTEGSGDEVWDDFLARPADYYALFAELGFTTEDPEKTQGDLPAEIVEAVRAFRLDTTHLTASLRGYQSFGAKFALVQGKVVIGDEMGLGKTVEALAVLTHLAATGGTERPVHFLVVCPAAVVTNWMREIQKMTTLTAHRLHGPAREAAAAAWRRTGGIAVTTFATLRSVAGETGPGPDAGPSGPSGNGRVPLGCVVVDEAQYIKNPEALRSKAVAEVLGRSERAVLLTGTPLMNRLEEFRVLIGYLQPDLVVDSHALAPARFRQQVAPAYLRRNQEDVLTELPELVEVEEVLPLSPADARAYRGAVAEGNFMAMRTAAFAAGAASEKLQRLVEIVSEAEENGRRVIVFSFFREVLDAVAGALEGPVFGPLTGSVPAARRQSMVDEFSAAPGGAALVAQVTAGGIGLNIQAASVVVLCEPQLNPAIEWQAIARARRMGQLETVQVHRLLTEEGVDQRLTQMLAVKAELFEQFAAESEMAEAAPEAVDVSEAELAREVIAVEQERLLTTL